VFTVINKKKVQRNYLKY